MKGEQVFDACGERWTLFLGNAAQCDLEEHFDKGFFAIVADAVPIAGAINPETMSDPAAMVALARNLRVSVLRELAWFGMRRQHPDLQLDDVSNLIDDLGQAEFGELIGKAIASTQGGDKPNGEAGGAAPGKPKRATRAKRPTG